MGKKKIALINNEVLKWIRSETPFSDVNNLLNRCKDIRKEDIELWESGLESPSINQARKLAKLYRVPLACFFLSSIPDKKPTKYVDRRTYFNTDRTDTSYELWKEIERIESIRDVLLDLQTENIDKLPTFNQDASISTMVETIHSYFDIDLPFKNKQQFNNNSFNYYKNKFEEKGIVIAQISDVDLNEMRGLSIYNDKFPIIAINNKDYERAKTFSLFHELAHLIRRSSSICNIDFSDKDDEEEKICNKLAASLLMPKKQFIEDANKLCQKHGNTWNNKCLQELGDRFGVSSITVLMRLFDLKIIGSDFYFEKNNELKFEFEKRKEEIDKKVKESNIPFYFYIKYLNKNGNLMPRTVLSSHYSGEISFGEACKIMNIKPKHFKDIERRVFYK